MPASDQEPVVIADARLRRAARRLKVSAWLCVIPALVIAHGDVRSQLGSPLGGDPDSFLIASCMLVALAPVLVAWGRVGARRRWLLAALGLVGAALMIGMIHVDMLLVDRAINLGSATAGWRFECIVPSGNYQAALTGVARLALILRVEAALIDALASARRPSHRRRIAVTVLGLILAAAAALPFCRFTIPDHVYTGLASPLPGFAYLTAFAVFEVCARLGRFGRRGGPTSKPPAKRAEPVAPSERPRPRPGRRLSPDPAALAQGHRALARARTWSRVTVGIGVLGLARVLVTDFGSGWGYGVFVFAAVAVLGLVVVPEPGRAPKREPPAELEHPQLRSLVELLERAKLGLEHGADLVLELLYPDFELAFAGLGVRELEWLAQRGLTRARLRAALDRGVDHEGGFEPDLRRALHRELSSMLAAVRGDELVDPYRADLRTSSFVDQLGLGWLRTDGERQDEELRDTRRSAAFTLFVSVAVALGLSLGAAWLGTDLPLAICVPGHDGCNWALGPSDYALALEILVSSSPLLLFVVARVHRGVAARSFGAALPRDDRTLELAPPSRAFSSLYERVAGKRALAGMARAVFGFVLLALIPMLVAVSEEVLRGPATGLTLASVLALALVCARPVHRGLRRLSAWIWLAWLRPDASASPEANRLAELVRCRVDLATALVCSDAQLEALARQIAVAPLATDDADAMLAHIGEVRSRLHHPEREWLADLEDRLVTCELTIADQLAGLAERG